MIILRNWFYIVSFISLIAISIALIAEYIFNLQPCVMCLKQRQPYYFILLIFILFYFFKNINNLWFYLLVQLASLYGLFYSIWHVGIEQKILSGPASCSGGLSISESVENLKEQIIGKAIINCEDVVWGFLGISAATINTFLLLLIFFLNAIYIQKHHASKKNTAS